MKSFTMAETLIVAFILGVVMMGLLLGLTTGSATWAVNTAMVDVKAELRQAASWIHKDVRQARRADLGSSVNAPSSSHIKFRMVTGYDVGTDQLTLSPNYIDYTYNATAQTITRTDLADGRSWTFHNITQPPFYTRTGDINPADGTYFWVIDPATGGDSPVLQTRNLVVRLTGQAQVKTGLTPVYTLINEVKIRNE